MILHGNALLRSLPPEESERLSPFFRRVETTAGQFILGQGEPLSHLWFFESGAATRLVQLHSGETVEVGTVGHDGVAGIPIALGGQLGLGPCIVQIAGTAQLISVSDFDEHVRGTNSPLMQALTVYAGVTIAHLTQLTACHCLHRVEQRLIRCLLTLDDYGAAGTLRITHDTLAGMLGVHRPSITYALQAIAATGAISLERRRVIIHNRSELQESACECYHNIKSMSKRQNDALKAALRG